MENGQLFNHIALTHTHTHMVHNSIELSKWVSCDVRTLLGHELNHTHRAFSGVGSASIWTTAIAIERVLMRSFEMLHARNETTAMSAMSGAIQLNRMCRAKISAQTFGVQMRTKYMVSH